MCSTAAFITVFSSLSDGVRRQHVLLNFTTTQLLRGDLLWLAAAKHKMASCKGLVLVSIFRYRRGRKNVASAVQWEVEQQRGLQSPILGVVALSRSLFAPLISILIIFVAFISLLLTIADLTQSKIVTISRSPWPSLFINLILRHLLLLTDRIIYDTPGSRVYIASSIVD